jgi:uncharacterized ion transporter superfamily protein YfcC
MKKRTYTIILAVLVAAAVVSFTLPALAQEQAQRENKVVRFFKNVIKWPFSITKEGAETVGRTTKKAVMTTTKTGSSAVETVTGKPEKIKDVIVEPVKGSGETAYTAVEGSVKTPVKGTEEAFKE